MDKKSWWVMGLLVAAMLVGCGTSEPTSTDGISNADGVDSEDGETNEESTAPVPGTDSEEGSSEDSSSGVEGAALSTLPPRFYIRTEEATCGEITVPPHDVTIEILEQSEDSFLAELHFLSEVATTAEGHQQDGVADVEFSWTMERDGCRVDLTMDLSFSSDPLAVLLLNYHFRSEGDCPADMPDDPCVIEPQVVVTTNPPEPTPPPPLEDPPPDSTPPDLPPPTSAPSWPELMTLRLPARSCGPVTLETFETQLAFVGFSAEDNTIAYYSSSGEYRLSMGGCSYQNLGSYGIAAGDAGSPSMMFGDGHGFGCGDCFFRVTETIAVDSPDLSIQVTQTGGNCLEFFGNETAFTCLANGTLAQNTP